MITEFVFVRHGETDANLHGVIQGHMDVPLNPLGITQAEAVAEYLKKEHFDGAFTSSLQRAVQTAEIVVARNEEGVPLKSVPELKEWFCGKIDGMRWDDVSDKYRYESRSFSFEQFDVRLPDGESCAEFQHRVENFLTGLLSSYGGKRILLVAHGGVLQRIFRMVTGSVAKGNLLPLAGNASVSSFIYNHKLEAWQLTSWNLREHLKGIQQHISRVL